MATFNKSCFRAEMELLLQRQTPFLQLLKESVFYRAESSQRPRMHGVTSRVGFGVTG